MNRDLDYNINNKKLNEAKKKKNSINKVFFFFL